MTDPHNKLAAAMTAHQAGRMHEAEQSYRHFLRSQPRHADACALLGLVVGARGDMVEAMRLVDQAITLDPSAGLLHFHRGTVLMAAQRFPEAIAAFQQAVNLQPGVAQIHYNYANALRAQGDWPAAIARYREALRLDPGFLDAYNNLALSLAHEKQYDAALQAARAAIACDSDFGDAWLSLCNIEEKLKNYPEALAAGQRACALMPGNHYAWFGYGVALNRVGRDEEAIDVYQKALALNPARADILDNLAQTYQSLNRLAEAEAAFRRAIEVDGQTIDDESLREPDESDYGPRHWHLALVELLQGKYLAGFARYRARFKEIKELKRPKLPFPLWRGEDLRGKTLLVYDEQGYGDTLMLARFLPGLKAGGARLIFSLHPVLAPLFHGWSGVDAVIAHGEPPPFCDYACATFDLPHRLRVTLQHLPAGAPYLPSMPLDARTRLPAVAGKKIGVVWSGSPLHLNNEKRSVPLAIFSRLFSASDCVFYCFNRDLQPGDADILARLPVVSVIPLLTDFAQAARLIGQMDLVITVDTATAHLAGGLGIPVWILLPHAPDWRWLTGRSDSPWYPTARLFRQPQGGGWDSVIDEVQHALTAVT